MKVLKIIAAFIIAGIGIILIEYPHLESNWIDLIRNIIGIGLVWTGIVYIENSKK